MQIGMCDSSLWLFSQQTET